MKIFDTLSAKMTDFIPLKENEVKMYVCGVTVYDECHLGHARAAICFDVIRKYLEFKGNKVTMIVNFTDVDDKIINRAKLEKVDALEISRRYIDKYFVDMDALKIERATVYPKATEHIDHIIKFIEALIERGFAYVVDGEVYFEVSKFAEYGKLSKRNFEDMLAGARIAVDERLKNPHDFCLWKAAKPGEISWKSPWAEGRPGWHIECSAMSGHYLGDTFDIHGGGLDLIFPHHENEIAQSEAKTGKTFAKYWLHNGLVNINSEKMSKSLGNFFTISALLEKFSPFVIRYFILSNHYRSPINFTVEKIQELEKALGSLTRFMKRMKQFASGVPAAGREGVKSEILAEADAFEAKFNEFMENDFNTAGAIGSMFQCFSVFNQAFAGEFPEKAKSAAYVYGVFMRYAELLAIADEDFIMAENVQQGANVDGLADELIKVLIKVRSTLKGEKNYKMADFVRDEIKAAGVVLEDTKEGTKFHIERK
ncbi:MAG: cysteine--tRNA ligase [Candidatus Wallbacteria bacterium GWC2_49_35]|uniref:Cysteine--tRNA ligase n=1 Tax=Candidatus Wallbacteria bacterium GWC2_49_35 TaxID=1817813 RepID=A0A1F7WZ36_9BACT|nr:MAG: cysteine--tRNA ligase [Candidatus Wallbacteria bacterium GWC2_49_35]HBC73884.1 cysteine--tRNA ligase [Candidatus Wallbacteria bacterium]